MINNNIAFKGYTYAQGNSPRNEVEGNYAGSTPKARATIEKAILKNDELVKQNASSKLDISILPVHACIKFVPDNIDKDNPITCKSITTIPRRFYETTNMFVKRVLQYTIKNRAELEDVRDCDVKTFIKV